MVVRYLFLGKEVRLPGSGLVPFEVGTGSSSSWPAAFRVRRLTSPSVHRTTDACRASPKLWARHRKLRGVSANEACPGRLMPCTAPSAQLNLAGGSVGLEGVRLRTRGKAKLTSPDASELQRPAKLERSFCGTAMQGRRPEAGALFAKKRFPPHILVCRSPCRAIQVPGFRSEARKELAQTLAAASKH